MQYEDMREPEYMGRIAPNCHMQLPILSAIGKGPKGDPGDTTTAMPTFANPAEWNSTRTYEPLTIVLHEGNSFTSKQFVPKGIDISNEDFWAETGNYNAQVEQYRQEVLRFDERINENTDSIENLKNDVTKLFGISFVGNYGALENDSSVNWQEIINAIAEVSNTVDFGNGQWIINEELDIPENIKRINGNGAIIKTTEHADTLLTITRSNPDYVANRYIFVISGISFYGDFNVDRYIYSTLSQIECIDCTFKDFNDMGVEFRGAGAVIGNCNFIISAKTTPFVNTTTGAWIQTDGKIHGCKFFGLHICIDTNDNNVITNNYFWIGMLTGLNYCLNGHDISGNDIVTGITFNNNEIDGYPYCFRNVAGTIQNNLILFNGAELYYQNPWTIFEFTLNSFKVLDFSFNTVDFVYGFQHETHTFLIHGERASAGVYEYTSKDNIVLNSRNEVLENLYVGFGCASQKYIRPNGLHLFVKSAVGINIYYEELFNYQGKYATYLADVSSELQMSIANIQHSSAYVQVPTIHKFTDDETLFIDKIRRGGALNNIFSKATNCLFEFVPIAPENITDTDVVLTVGRYGVTIA